MLESFVSHFDYNDFEKKLKHYFSDSCPTKVSIELNLNKVTVFCFGKDIVFSINNNMSVQDNIGFIISNCESKFYPKMLDLVVAEAEPSFSTEDKIKELLFLGYTMEQILEKISKNDVIKRKYVLTRFNLKKNTVDYKRTDGILFRAYLKKPLLMCREKIIDLSQAGVEGEKELYKFITENSKKIEELQR